MTISSRILHLDGIGDVLLQKSDRSRRITMTVRGPETIRVAVPRQIPYAEAERFVREKTGWLHITLGRLRRLAERQAGLSGRFASMNKVAARSSLVKRLEELADIYGFSIGRITVREQKTRWGSCSYCNNISLNIKLALLPNDLRDYVLLHELVHTKVHNHSAAFWRELDKYTGDGRSFARRLRQYDLRLI